jgi:hypothetical protein
MAYAPTQEQRWDHARDLRKHDTDPLPIRLAPDISPAMQIAILVKGEKNYELAAALIDAYADDKAAQQRLEAVAAGARP